MNIIDETHLLLNLVTAVQQAAINSYNLSFGWSEIVECWTKEEIFHELKQYGMRTQEEAVNHFALIAKDRSEYAKEIESTAW